MYLVDILQPTIHPVVSARAVLLLSGCETAPVVVKKPKPVRPIAEQLILLRARLRYAVKQSALMRERRDRLAGELPRGHAIVKEARLALKNVEARAEKLRAEIRDLEKKND